MSLEARELRQRKMVPHASLPQKTIPPSTTDFGTRFGFVMPEEKAGLINESFEPMGSFDSMESSEGTQSPTAYSELDSASQGSAPKKKPTLKNGGPRFSGGDTAVELDTLADGFDEEETSLTEPLLSDEDAGPRSKKNNNIQKKEIKDLSTDVSITPTEASWQIGLQVFFPYVIAGLGMVAAGIVLDIVQHWDVFVHVSEVFIMVPALLGLKGNLEMTLASRLSTQANLGNMDSSKEQWKMIGGNLALIQAQALVVGFLAAVAAMILGWIPEGKFDVNHMFLLGASSVLTAAFASFVLGVVMSLVVILSRKCNVNPDNVATPIAASLGDLTTLALLSGIATLFYKAIANDTTWLAPLLLAIFMCLTPVWCYVAHKNKYTHEVLYSGWTPVIGAMVISSLGGLILDFAVGNYNGIAVFQPVINGVGGNLVAVQASRLSTALHQASRPGILPEDAVHGCPNVCNTFFGKNMSARTARVLMLMVIPGHLIFMYTIHYMEAGHTSITLVFAAAYLTAACIQVALLLYIANWLVHYLWKKGKDPDNFSIPYLTAMGDLLGTGLLALAFHILYVIGDRDADVGD